MAVNEATAFYDAGADITGHVDVAVVGRRFVKINAARQPGGPAGIQPTPDDAGHGNVRIAPADAAGRVFGVASHDGAIGSKVTVLRPPKVVPVDAGADLNAFEEVEVGVAGRAIPLAAGVAVGYVLDDCDNGDEAQVHLY